MRKILILFIMITNIITFSNDFPKEYRTERESKERRVCNIEKRKVGEKKNPAYENCMTSIAIDEDTCEEYNINIDVYEDVEVCHWESYDEYRDVWTGKFVTRDAAERFNVVARQRAEEAVGNKITLTAEERRDQKKTGRDESYYLNRRIEKAKSKIFESIDDYGKNTGNDATNNRVLLNDLVDINVKETIKEIVAEYNNDELTIQEHRFASSKQARKIHEELYNLPKNVKYYNTNKPVDGTKEPIILDYGSLPSISEIQSGRPIYIRNNTITNSNNESSGSNYDEPNIYVISFDGNGEESGTTPSNIEVKEYRYFTIPDNIGNLTKEGYKFIGWNTRNDGRGITYMPGKSIIIKNSLHLYAKWEVVNKVLIPNIENSDTTNNNVFKIRFINNEYSRINGNDTILVNKGESINNIPNIVIDRGYILKEFIDNNNVIRTEEEVKNFIPTENLNLLVVTEKDKRIPKKVIPIGVLIPATPNNLSTIPNRPRVIYNNIDVYVGDVVNVDDFVNREGLDRYIILWEEEPNTSSSGITEGRVYLIDAITKEIFDGYPKGKINVLPIPVLTYKNNRTKAINNEILVDDLISNKLDDRYTIEIINEIDTSTIGTKVVNLKVIDNITGKYWENYTTDILLTENLDNLNWNENPEVYVGDDVNDLNIIINSNNIPEKYNITIIRKPDTSISNDNSEIEIRISNPTSGSSWTVTKNIKVLNIPNLEYKDDRRKEINNNIIYEDVVLNKLDERYIIEINNEIDITTIGLKDVNLKVIDVKTGRYWTHYNTNINLFEILKELDYINNNDIYIGDNITVDDVINPNNIPQEYEIKILTNPDTNTSGDNKPFKIEISNPSSGSVWEIDREINVIEEPSLIGNLWIYQNDKFPNDKGREFINEISVDLNDKFIRRYDIKFISPGDVSKIGTTKFTYQIIDTVKNRTFIKTIDVNVIEEIINPTINQNVEYFVGEYPKISDLINNISDEYTLEILNYNDFEELRKTPGNKIAKLKIKSKITDKIWHYDVILNYNEKIIDLGILIWEVGEILTLDEIKTIKNIDTDMNLVLRVPNKLRYDVIEEYNAEILIYDNDNVYTVGELKIKVVDNISINELDKIDKGNKIYLINEINNISNKMISKLSKSDLNKKSNLWIEKSGSNYKYIANHNMRIIGGKIGYDKNIFKNILLGGYLGYDRINFNLTDKSIENSYNIGAYLGGKKNIINEINLIYGLTGQYNFITGNLNFKNVRNDKINYNFKSNNIIINSFVGSVHKLNDESNLNLIVGSTTIFNFNNDIKNRKQNINVNNNITNEIYASIGVKRNTNKFDLYGSLKLGYIYGKTHYLLNDIKFNKKIKKYDITTNFGYRYKLNDENKIGFEVYYKNNDAVFKSRYGLKLNYEHIFEK